jgi:hypothetical protein
MVVRGLVLAIRYKSLLNLTFSRSIGFKNMLPHTLYLLQASTGQSYIMCILYSLPSPYSWQSCWSLSPSLYMWVLRVVLNGSSPTEALSLNLLNARSFLSLPGRGYLSSVFDWRQPVQASHLVWWSSSKCLLTYFSGSNSGTAEWDCTRAFAVHSVCFFVVHYSLMPGYPH